MAVATLHNVARMILWATAIWLFRQCHKAPEDFVVSCGALICLWVVLKSFVICLRTLNRRHSSPLKGIPGPESINWLYDHVFDIFDEPLAFNITKWINQRPYPAGLMHFFGLFGSSYIIPTTPETLKDVLSTHAYDYEKATAFKTYTTRFWGHGIVSQEQEEHRQNRKTYLPVFNQGNVRKLAGTLFTKATQFADRISDPEFADDSPPPHLRRAGVSSAVVPIVKLSALISLDVTGILAFGVDFETILGRRPEIFEAHETLFASTKEKRRLFLLYNLAPRWLIYLIPFPVARKMDQARTLLYNVCRETIRQQRRAPSDPDEAQPLHFLGHLKKTDGLREEEAAIAQIVVILGAGTGGTLAWVFNCLAAHPQSQDAIRRELAGCQDEPDADYDQLPMLHAVVMEAVRLYPGFTFLLRKAIRDTTIGDQPIPRNTFVGLCTRAINYAEHLWGPDAAAFVPERWLERSPEGRGIRINPLGGAPAAVCMLSFFHGTRSCVGRELALAQMKRQIAVVVRRFRLETVGGAEDVRPCGLFATTPPPDLLVRFTELEG
ncbi:cytochrome P450 [Aspergillus indologenus CBS 114.80]|uniref:Cytochrome P450 n=1 Tax=Aspergillus indologenus CBS 114.80 TaxID=1450541 RepID=A0A2V5JGH0_9EURO|nr:cytochrome P450 [Aspergillus indologenus CBS 114.80]